MSGRKIIITGSSTMNIIVKAIHILLIVSLTSSFKSSPAANPPGKNKEDKYYKISVEDYRQKVYSSWLGQLVGNAYGLPHENKYIDEPGPETFPFGYTSKLAQLQEVNGAFSDDDTDVEYMYLLQMEKYGPEPRYAQLVNGWKYHIRESVWLANRAALGLMHFGFTPPFTGMKANNPHWFQIDPQLVNEIWAVTSPGMLNYATGKSSWAARITSDGWGIEPTIHYGAMFSAAFFESDIYKLIDIGTAALPEGSRFAETVEDMKALYKKYPDSWRRARREMADKYYRNEPRETKSVWSANLNGACGILALLYGKGDFQRTLDMAVVMGFDADNQTATMSGLIGLINGERGIPKELLYPVQGWKKPFNDLYVNVTRYDMPNVGIKKMTERMALMGEKIILMKGGRKVLENGKYYYLINKEAVFVPPLELPGGPKLVFEVGKPVADSILVIGGKQAFQWKVLKGNFPEGIKFNNGMITGTAAKAGEYTVSIQVQQGAASTYRNYNMVVRGHNLARDAVKILSNVMYINTTALGKIWQSVPKSIYADSIGVIRDGITNGKGETYLSINGSNLPKTDYYGYEWEKEQQIGSLTYHTGAMEEIAGWFTSLNVEFRDNAGNWKPVQRLVITPALIGGNHPYNKPHFVEYVLSFGSVKTTAIRMIGQAGGGEHWYSGPAYFTSISELGVYEFSPAPIPKISLPKKKR
jgi:hypothetical protein